MNWRTLTRFLRACWQSVRSKRKDIRIRCFFSVFSVVSFTIEIVEMPSLLMWLTKCFMPLATCHQATCHLLLAATGPNGVQWPGSSKLPHNAHATCALRLSSIVILKRWFSSTAPPSPLSWSLQHLCHVLVAFYATQPAPLPRFKLAFRLRLSLRMPELP